MQKTSVVIRNGLREKFQLAMANSRVIFLSAACGYGKTVAVEALLAGQDILELTPELLRQGVEGNGSWKVLVADHVEQMNDHEDQQKLCDLIRQYPQRRFVLQSRGPVPGWLIPFQFTGLLTTIEAKDLQFDRETTRDLFKAYGMEPTKLQMDAMMEKTEGYPLAAFILCRHLKGCAEANPVLVEQARRQMYLYLEEAVYRRFPTQLRQLLLELSCFDSFDPELARMVSGNSRVHELLEQLQRETTLLQQRGPESYEIWPIFRRFLRWEMERNLPEERRLAIYSRGGLYYELKEDLGRALECYARSGDHNRISELLVKNAEYHPGMGHYEKTAQYYESLPEADILASPALMQSMSMLCALKQNYEKSEYWYGELLQSYKQCPRTDAACREMQSRLMWLEISLPQRSVENFPELIPKVCELQEKRELILPSFSVTSALPSVLNGGKDLCLWTKRDDELCRELREPLGVVLGRDGVGMLDCALAESKFEKGEDMFTRMLALVPQINDIQQNGTPDIEFALVGLLARTQVDTGRASDARNTTDLLKKRYEETGNQRFLPNIEAMICRLNLRTGHKDAVEAWYEAEAPRNPYHMHVMWRYRYLTEAMVELAAGDEKAALLTLSPLEPFCRACHRTMDLICLRSLQAVAHHRMGDPAWQKELAEALDLSREYGFIRPVGQYGAAILPLLTATAWHGDRELLRRITEHAREQAVYYPNFLRPGRELAEPLTTAEMQVLRLLCADKSNGEIGEILNIKLATVKSHVSHILQKLDVKRRSEAKTAAEQLQLFR